MKKELNKANLEFPGGINDWFAFGTLLIIVGIVPSLTLMVLSETIMDFFSSYTKFKLSTLFISIAVFCYYWIYYRNIDWLKERIEKVNKKYSIK